MNEERNAQILALLSGPVFSIDAPDDTALPFT